MNKIDNQDNEIEIELEDDASGGNKDCEKEIKKIKAKLRSCLDEKKEYLDGWQRAKADYLNLQQKIITDKENSIKLAKADIVKDLLSLADSFEMAFKNKGFQEELPDNWQQGIEMIYNRLKEIFDNNGVKEINPINELFDHNLHEAAGVQEIQEAEKDQLVSEVLEKGYSLYDKIIRPAKVIVLNFNKK